jgi:hypothetical protein
MVSEAVEDCAEDARTTYDGSAKNAQAITARDEAVQQCKDDALVIMQEVLGEDDLDRADLERAVKRGASKGAAKEARACTEGAQAITTDAARKTAFDACKTKAKKAAAKAMGAEEDYEDMDADAQLDFDMTFGADQKQQATRDLADALLAAKGMNATERKREAKKVFAGSMGMDADSNEVDMDIEFEKFEDKAAADKLAAAFEGCTGTDAVCEARAEQEYKDVMGYTDADTTGANADSFKTEIQQQRETAAARRWPTAPPSEPRPASGPSVAPAQSDAMQHTQTLALIRGSAA